MKEQTFLSISGKRRMRWSRADEFNEVPPGDKLVLWWLQEKWWKEAPVPAPPPPTKAAAADLGGENRTGEEEEEEQRILLEETGGGDDDEDGDCKSSKKFDLLPHTMADMLCRRLQSLQLTLFFLPLPTLP